MELIDYVDSINVAHGATTGLLHLHPRGPGPWSAEALAYDLHLLQARCKHLGTENNLRIPTNIYEDLRKDITFQFDTAVTAIRRDGAGYCLRPPTGTNTPPPGSSPPPAGPAPSGSPTSAAPWACP